MEDLPSHRLATRRRPLRQADDLRISIPCDGVCTTDNAVKSHIWIAVSVYVLVAIIKKRLNLDASPYTLLQMLTNQMGVMTPRSEAEIAALRTWGR